MKTTSSVRFLVFAVDDLKCAVPVERVVEIGPAVPVTRIPGAHPAVRGMITVRGEFLVLVDARTALQQIPTTHRYSIVLVESDRCRFGLAVDDVEDMVSVGQDDLSVRSTLPGVQSPFVRGIGVHDDVTFAVLDVDELTATVMPSEEAV